MDWKEFITTLVDSLAWPAGVALIAVLFRRQLAALIEAPLKTLKAGPVEFEWDHAAAHVVEQVTSTLPAPEQDDEDVDPLMILADLVPTAAVIESFSFVERELRAISAKGGISDADRKTVELLLREGVQHEVITPETAEAIRGLKVLRNLAAHGGAPDVTSQRAREFVVLSNAVLFALRRGDGHDR